MQVTKTYAGTVSLEDKTEKRTVSYGAASASFLRTRCRVMERLDAAHIRVLIL